MGSKGDYSANNDANNDDVKRGKQFIELLGEQNDLQWNIIGKLSLLVDSKWSSAILQNELEILIKNHSKITKQLNSIDDKNSLL